MAPETPAGEQLIRSESLYQAIIDAAPDAMIGVDRAGTIVMANRQTTTLFGYEPSDLVGEHLELLVPERFRGVHPEHRADYFREPKPRPMGVGLELGGRRADGSEFPAEISLSSIQTEHGPIALAAIRDISDRRQVEAELRRARQNADRAAVELRRANEELESFSYAVAHDLRAPLRAIDGFSQALVDDLGDDIGQGARGDVARVRRNVQMMSEMIDGLLGLSRLTRSSIEQTDVDLSAMVEESIATLQAAEPHRQVDVRIEPDLVASADLRLVRVLIDNLVANAWKFTAPSDPAMITFSARLERSTRVYSIEDNGVGFDDRYAEKLFAPFQRLHRMEDFPGSGIGLATAARVVRRHGGTIEAHSEVGRGATFSFTFGSTS